MFYSELDNTQKENSQFIPRGGLYPQVFLNLPEGCNERKGKEKINYI